MTKLLQNKPIIKFLGIALSILLIVALVPQINIAYGSKDDVLVDTGTEESAEGTSDSEGTEGTEDAEGEEEGGLSDENALDGEILGEEEPPTGEEAGIMATALPEENPETVAETPVETTSKELAGNASQPIDGDVTNTSIPSDFQRGWKLHSHRQRHASQRHQGDRWRQADYCGGGYNSGVGQQFCHCCIWL